MTVSSHPAGSDEDRTARAALSLLAEPGNRAMWSMVQQLGAPQALESVLHGDIDDDALRVRVLSRMGSFEGTQVANPRRLGQATLRRARRLGCRIVVPSDAEWPHGLDELPTVELNSPDRVDDDLCPPLCLWARGEVPVAETLQRSVAVVGARAATAYGIQVTTDLAYGLAQNRWTVVSGGAFGIDAAAHRGALAAGGTTVSILASGIDRPYPAGNSALFEDIAARGLLISEWPPGSEPLRRRFLLRNRTIAAATTASLLTESAARSGSIQMMSWAFRLGRPGMVVPGPVTSAMSVGSHDLLRAEPKAILVTGLAQVLEVLGRAG